MDNPDRGEALTLADITNKGGTTVLDDIRITLTSPDLLPVRAHEGDAGADLKAAEDTIIPPGEYRTIPSGVRIAVPFRHVGLVFSRSGLAVKNGLRLANCVGVIDHGYTGEIGLPLYNDSDAPRIVRRGDRVAQLVLLPVELPFLTWKPSRNGKGNGRFGSTGIIEARRRTLIKRR